ncbi:MAG: hypothetical protein GC171_02990 [Terrimonas sp.]|nr:hypothetical protein [Terrimonas sp.]
MKTATVQEIKQELSSLKPKELIDLSLRLARFKKENKELMTFLLFEAHDEAGYVAGIKLEVDELFTTINTAHLYFAKKTIRKILRYINKYIRYTGSKEVETELLIYFCKKLKESGIPFDQNLALHNLYLNQVRKIKKSIQGLHEDIQHDYRKELALLD